MNEDLSFWKVWGGVVLVFVVGFVAIGVGGLVLMLMIHLFGEKIATTIAMLALVSFVCAGIFHALVNGG